MNSFRRFIKEKTGVWNLIFLFSLLVAVPFSYAAGEFEEVFSQAEEEDSDPSAFEGDSENMPGERAPENMPMDDAPVDAGIGAIL
ncbi:MAG TPA: hypothetical protein P5561_02715 [Candidatus Omnitrophota bacterium]|nr:hypothetical protein [Candidatus Omnitrophota bacterium]HRY85426.1 hypothetical protein [Candidatus Omnitrophota bacterium]